jgi:hypothetical protein
MKNTEDKTKRSPQPRRNSTLAKARAVAGALLASPALTVNSVMVWLNETLGVNVPTLPLAGWREVLQSLWELLIQSSDPSENADGDLPTGPLPWIIRVDGSWSWIFPQGGSPPVALENLEIRIYKIPVHSPD